MIKLLAWSQASFQMPGNSLIYLFFFSFLNQEMETIQMSIKLINE